MLTDVIILAGGFGTRLRSISQDVPKPLMPVGNRRFLDFVIGWLLKSDIKKIVLSLHYKPEIFREYLANRSFPAAIDTIVEPVPMGTGGAIKYVLEKTEVADTFGVINGDTFLDFDLRTMADNFRSSNCSAMLGLSRVEDAARYGIVSYRNTLALAFSEKGSTEAGWINNGCYLFKKAVFSRYQGAFSI